ncbi:MAG TPA: hypothetical protein PLE19_07455 [Planctomycetota bacterium]|nr:hypothetical protein [Planctomycetota bacterium]HRR80149.1 hypothetical protein [Planctomycetota bacterium]HRT97299.1 hypothetical protein [Planctomycetota bacterium]
MSRCRVMGALALGLVVSLSDGAKAAEDKGAQPVAVTELPAAVADAVTKLCPEGKITAAKKEADRDDKGQLKEIDFDLEVAMKSGKVHKVEIDATPEGAPKLEESEAHGPVAEADLPAVVIETAKKLCPEGKIGEGERRARFNNGKVECEYEIPLTVTGNQKAELKVGLDAEGALRSTRLTAPTGAADVPKVIAELLNVVSPGATIAEVEKQTEARNDKVRVAFELKLKTADGKSLRADVRLTADGRIRGLEVRED